MFNKKKDKIRGLQSALSLSQTSERIARSLLKEARVEVDHYDRRNKMLSRRLELRATDEERMRDIVNEQEQRLEASELGREGVTKLFDSVAILSDIKDKRIEDLENRLDELSEGGHTTDMKQDVGFEAEERGQQIHGEFMDLGTTMLEGQPIRIGAPMDSPQAVEGTLLTDAGTPVHLSVHRKP